MYDGRDYILPVPHPRCRCPHSESTCLRARGSLQHFHSLRARREESPEPAWRSFGAPEEETRARAQCGAEVREQLPDDDTSLTTTTCIRRTRQLNPYAISYERCDVKSRSTGKHSFRIPVGEECSASAVMSLFTILSEVFPSRDFCAPLLKPLLMQRRKNCFP